MFPAGLCKLMEAEQSVSQLSEQLVVKEQELAVASQRANEVLQEVTAKAQAAEQVRRTATSRFLDPNIVLFHTSRANPGMLIKLF